MKKKTRSFRFILFVITFIVLSCQSALAQEGLTKIADDVYSYVDMKNPSPAKSYGANAGIIIGKDGIVVIDTLVSSKEAKRFIKDIRAISDKPIKYVVNTHFHLDHSFGNSEFVKLGATIISHTNCKQNLEKNAGITLKNVKDYGLTDEDMYGTSIAFPVLTFDEKMEIDLSGQIIELIYTRPSHTNDSIMVYLPDKKILFAGDIMFTNYHPAMMDGDIKGWVKSLDFIKKLKAEKIIPGHGPLSTNKDIADMRTYLLVFDKKAKQLSTESYDPEYIAAELKKILPAREYFDYFIKWNVQAKYIKNQSETK